MDWELGIGLVDRTGSTRLLAMAPLQRDVTASGVRLRVAESGAGPTVVLIHGLFVDHTSWDRVAELMTGRFRVIAPDLPGFGESERREVGRNQTTDQA